MSTKSDFQSSSPWRWVVLCAYMLITLVTQLQWLTHAPIARAAAVFYQGQFNPDSVFQIDFLAMSYMLLYLVFSIPASLSISRFGVSKTVVWSSAVIALASLAKGVFATSFTAVVISQIALAAVQPFILNAVTALTARWFAPDERGTAAGLAALAQYVGIVLAMLITPLLISSNPANPDYGSGIDRMLMAYGVFSALVSLGTILIFHRSPEPATTGEQLNYFKGVGSLLKQPSMIITILLFFIGLGIFNAVSSMVDSIAGFLGVEDSDGLIGGIMLIGGIIGAVILPMVSDALKVRKPLLIVCMAGMALGVILLTYAPVLSPNPKGAYALALAASAILGFFVMSAGPIGFQYAAEISAPAPETASQGLLLLAGQISGLVFVALMSVNANAMLPNVMRSFTWLSLIAFVIVFFPKESPWALRQRSIGTLEEGSQEG